MICEKNDTETLSQHSTKKKVTKLEHKLGNIEKTAAGGKNRLEIKVTSYAHRIFEAMRRMGEISF